MPGPALGRGRQDAYMSKALKRPARKHDGSIPWIVVVPFAISGVIHLVKPAVFEPIIPKPLRGKARELVVASGVAELACAAGLLRESTRPAAGARERGRAARGVARQRADERRPRATCSEEEGREVRRRVCRLGRAPSTAGPAHQGRAPRVDPAPPVERRRIRRELQ
ncbi:hypothetical protein ACFPRL_33080 [Pseudoclavibacter helvolus]